MSELSKDMPDSVNNVILLGVVFGDHPSKRNIAYSARTKCFKRYNRTNSQMNV